MFDRRFHACVAVFCAYLVALVPAFLAVGWINLALNLHVSFQAVNMALFTIAIVVVWAVYTRKK